MGQQDLRSRPDRFVGHPRAVGWRPPAAWGWPHRRRGVAAAGGDRRIRRSAIRNYAKPLEPISGTGLAHALGRTELRRFGVTRGGGRALRRDGANQLRRLLRLVWALSPRAILARRSEAHSRGVGIERKGEATGEVLREEGAERSYAPRSGRAPKHLSRGVAGGEPQSRGAQKQVRNIPSARDSSIGAWSRARGDRRTNHLLRSSAGRDAQARPRDNPWVGAQSCPSRCFNEATA
jgi:hypothetical protein